MRFACAHASRIDLDESKPQCWCVLPYQFGLQANEPAAFGHAVQRSGGSAIRAVAWP
jgi:hypothetical protein